MKLSFIIPIYNGAEYIARCLDSIVKEMEKACKDFPDWQYEILAINDGSKDNSAEVISKYIDEKISKIEYIDCLLFNRENGGVAAARNFGIETATGDYVAFADQDDYLMPGGISKMFEAVIEDTYDMIIGGFCRQDDKGKTVKQYIPDNTEWSKYRLTYPWGRMIKRSFLIDNNLRFLKTGIGEDVYFDLVAYSYTDKIKMVEDVLYCWYDNKASVSNTQYVKVNDLVDPTVTFDAIMRDKNNTGFDGSDYKAFLEYYLIKFIVWFEVTNIRRSERAAYKKMKKKLWGWMDKNFPGWKKNKYLKLGKLKGESVLTEMVVRIWKKA